MSLLKKAGTYYAIASLPGTAEELFTTSKSGKDGLYLRFTTEDGEIITTTLWLSPNAYERTLQVLEQVFKFDGDFNALARTLTFPNLECEIVVEMEEFTNEKGETRSSPKVKWINSRGPKRTPANVASVLSRLAKLAPSKMEPPKPRNAVGDAPEPATWQADEHDDIPF